VDFAESQTEPELADVHALPVRAAPRRLDGQVQVVECGELMIRIRAEAEASMLELYGELELANAGTLERELHVLEEGIAPKTIIVDLSALAFIDTSGLSALVSADRRAREGGWSFGLLRPVGQVERILLLTGLWENLHFLD
jgi:anti-sigma B factor antagonist